MYSMLKVLATVPRFRLFRQFGFFERLPLNITLTPSLRCNSRCRTCNIWKKQSKELTLDEWERVLRSLGSAPYWFTISGGEPFLYPGIEALCRLVYAYGKPGIINIPTNCLVATIPEQVRHIAESCPKTQFIINLSLDGIGSQHDDIRGIPGNFERFERTLAALLALRDDLPNLMLGIHSVISVFNVDHLEELIQYADQSGVNQFITEIAEARVELGTMDSAITPEQTQYAPVADRLVAYIEDHGYRQVARITEAFRIEYYRLVKRILAERTQVLPCYAGWASAQIYADGTVWECCVRADDLGNLRDYDYDFGAIWFGERIKAVRQSVATKECHCPLANAAYTNMLHHLPTLTKVGARVILPNWRNRHSRVQQDNAKRHATASEEICAP